MDSNATISSAKTDRATKIQFSDIIEIEDIQLLQNLYSDVNRLASVVTNPDVFVFAGTAKYSHLSPVDISLYRNKQSGFPITLIAQKSRRIRVHDLF